MDRPLGAVAVDAALNGDHTIIAVAQGQSEIQHPYADDLSAVGTEAVIGRVPRIPDGATSILVQRRRRVKRLASVGSVPKVVVIPREAQGRTRQAIPRIGEVYAQGQEQNLD